MNDDSDLYLEDEDGAPYPEGVQQAHHVAVAALVAQVEEYEERISNACSRLAYFGYQMDPVIALLEGRDGTA